MSDLPPAGASRLTAQEMAAVLRRALAKPGLIGAEDTALIFHDLEFMAGRCRQLQRLFPDGTLHAVAIKANPLGGVLRAVVAEGLGLEAASLPELHLALQAGAAAENIVFDSPVKTRAELAEALRLGVHINADSLAELARIEELLRGGLSSTSTIGLRVNPQVGAGTIQLTSVAGRYSKFGVPLSEQREDILAAFCRYPWLGGLHVHVGSQGCPLPLLVEGVARISALAEEINDLLGASGRCLQLFDLGGGLPVNYAAGQEAPGLSEYLRQLRQQVPALFTGSWRLITEFGRLVQANAGWVASRVEYVKSGLAPTLMVHVGADLFLRRCYRPDDWHHDLSLADAEGFLRLGPPWCYYAVAGPLCFAGDLLAREAELPVASAGDYLLVHDAGAYTVAMWSRYNSRQIPKIIGYRAEEPEFLVLKERETLDDLAAFWS